jgi:hypothetical protein
MYLRTCGSKSENLPICNLRYLFVDRPPLRFDECFHFFHVFPSFQVVSQLGSAGANAQGGKKTGARETFPVDPATLP